MNEVVSINIREENGKQIVSARELHEKLEVAERFNSWFERMLAYGFEENVDFTSVKSFTVVNNGARKPIDESHLKIMTSCISLFRIRIIQDNSLYIIHTY